MVVIIEGKIKTFDAENSTVNIENTEGNLIRDLKITKRAMWDFCYLTFGRKKTLELNKKFGIVKVFLEAIRQQNRNLQFIHTGKSIIATATIKHDVTKSEIYEKMFDELIKQKFKMETSYYLGFSGKTVFLQQTNLAEVGIQFFSGDITTFKAIRITNAVVITSCLNPISYLKIRKGILLTHSEVMKNINPEIFLKIKRFESRTETRQRISQAIDVAVNNLKVISEFYEKKINTEINDEEAKYLLSAFSYSYGVSVGIMQEVWERYKFKEVGDHGNTIWALAMASSWVARYSQNFRNDLRRQNLSTLAGALTLIVDVKKAVETIKHEFRNNKYFKQRLKVLEILG
ncbi:MAG: hypothetical protein DRO01_00080 [Thermoproteota archaeon]|nr:MAG: hypothetical protein DRO01_00080 [Candidatus Korarchaeota archaeon]